eukprot:scaffold2995_cov135-Skeletonema_menzelii.AAC.2
MSLNYSPRYAMGDFDDDDRFVVVVEHVVEKKASHDDDDAANKMAKAPIDFIMVAAERSIVEAKYSIVTGVQQCFNFQGVPIDKVQAVSKKFKLQNLTPPLANIPPPQTLAFALQLHTASLSRRQNSWQISLLTPSTAIFKHLLTPSSVSDLSV